jgi:clan AA aspartic protease
MITGMVKSDEGRIRINVMGFRGREREVEAVIDTGYTGSITLPAALIAALGLRFRSVDRALLADGSECVLDVYHGKMIWERKVRRVLVHEAETEPLIGMRLLRDHELKMQVRYRGKVTIKRLPSR